MKLLVTGAWSDGKKHINELEAMGHTVIFQQQESEPLVCPAQDVEGVICNGLFLYHPIEEFTSLKYIQLTSAGYDRVPLDVIRQRGIEIHNAGNVYSAPMFIAKISAWEVDRLSVSFRLYAGREWWRNL